ncbi:MAG: hypothetical protein MZV49_00970 [Rhodopseudomonas palustris]|nr:hypothetical protein [Rhodopseudomonas palustris]
MTTSFVIARSEATKQSSFEPHRFWIASPSARNDGKEAVRSSCAAQCAARSASTSARSSAVTVGR